MKELVSLIRRILKEEDFQERIDSSLCAEPDLIECLNGLINKLGENKKRILRIRNERDSLKLKLEGEVYQTQQFVHILCHDLRNPLGACSTYEELIGEDSSRAPIYLPKIFGNITRSLEMLEEVKKLMSVSQGKIKLELDYFPLKPLIEESLLILEETIKKKNINIELDLRDEDRVLIDKGTFVTSVVNNIITNAVKFSEEGKKVKIYYKRTKNLFELKFRDFGIGMGPKLLEQVFDPLEQTARNGTLGERGTGFGMPLIKRFVESYEGSIEVFSWDINEFPNDHGTEIIVKLWAN